MLLRGSEQTIRTLDGRRLAVALPPRQLSARLPREGFPYKEKDATGQRTARKGDLIVYLFCRWPELQAQAAQWLRMLATVGAVYLFFVNPTAVLMIFALYRFVAS